MAFGRTSGDIFFPMQHDEYELTVDGLCTQATQQKTQDQSLVAKHSKNSKLQINTQSFRPELGPDPNETGPLAANHWKKKRGAAFWSLCW